MTAVDQSSLISLFTLVSIGLICIFAIADINDVRARLIAEDPNAKAMGATDLALKLPGSKKTIYGLATAGVLGTFLYLAPMPSLSLPSVGSLFGSKPSADEIEKQVSQVILSDGKDNIFGLANFQKVNGRSSQPDTYIADITYDLVFKVSLDDVGKHTSEEAGGGEVGEFSSIVASTAMLYKFGQFKAGDKLPKSESVTFHKTENGWLLDSSYQPNL